MWCVARLDTEYMARMEEVLAIYEKPLSESEPVVCVDEKPVVLHQEVRPPVADEAGTSRTAGLRISALRNGERVLRRRAEGGTVFHQSDRPSLIADFADYLLEVAASYPTADTIHLVMDNLSTHTRKALGELRRESRRLAVEPVHGTLHAQTRKLA